MSDKETKKNILERETTRREFLKMSGKGIGGLAISLSLLNLLGCSKDDADKVTVWPLATGVLIANRNKCTGCLRCETNCTMVNDGKLQPYISRVKVSKNYFFGTDGPKLNYANADGAFGNKLMTPEACKQCADPYCGRACPAKAITTNDKGARVVDPEKCVACGKCHEACPWHLPTIDPEANVSTKCTACGFCASNCPTGALSIVAWEDIKYAMKRYGYMA